MIGAMPPAEHATTPHAYAEVNLDAIAHNVGIHAAHTRADVLAVVKADGFGHGALQVAGIALASGATWLGVTTCAEALALRAGGITAPILSWLHSPAEDFGPAISADIDLSAASPAHLRAVAEGAARAGRRANVHLKVDTGLHRNGAVREEWPELIGQARRAELDGHVRVRGIWSHLISGIDPDGQQIRAQVKLFEEAVELARDAGLRPELRHLANSVATLAAPETHYELVRPGIALYGVEPHPQHHFGLRGAMTLRARVIVTKRVPAGSGVSYEHDYITEHDGNLALVPLGYADGVPFSSVADAEVWIAGRRYPVAGRVAMDQFVVDLGDDPATVGAEVIVFGPGDQGEPTVAEWARWAHTIPHEIVTRIGPRVARRYVGASVEGFEEVPGV